MKAIETEYKGYKFRSRLEARWAVFFDACGVKWEYEPEGFDLGDGLYYLPDFLLHDVWVRNHTKIDLWVEVKGVMSELDAKKIIKFANVRADNFGYLAGVEHPILVVTNIPNEDEYDDFFGLWGVADVNLVPFFNFDLVDGDFYTALPCISPQGRFALVGSDYTENIDDDATGKAYALARQARFEHRKKKFANRRNKICAGQCIEF